MSYRIVQFDTPTDTVGHVIFDPKTGRAVSAGTLTLKESDIDDMSLTVNPTNYLFTNARPLQTHFEVWEGGTRIFRGRLLKPQRAMESSGAFTRTYTCESILAYLIDSIQPYGVFHNISVADFLGTLLTNHNAVVPAYKQVKLGQVTVKDSNDSIYRYIGYATTLDTIKDNLVSRLGGYLRLRVESDGLYLDYLADVGEDHANDTPIAIGRNLQSASVTIDPTAIITRLWPLGATVTTDTEVSTTTDASQPRVEIGTVNGGLPYIDAPELQAEFDIINGVQTWDDATLPANVLANGKAWLAAQAAATESWSVSAVELGGSFQSFRVSDRYRFLNAGVAEPTLLRVTQKQIDFARPQSSQLTIGSRQQTLTRYQIQAARERATQAKLQGTVAGLVQTAQTLTTKMTEADATIKVLQQTIEQLQSSMSKYYEGAIIDVSYYQDTIDWAAAQAAGLALAIIRVQDGTSFIDPKYQENLTAVTGLGINYAVYAFFRALDAADAATEATNFFNRTQETVAGKTQPRFYCIDVEKETVTSGTMAAAVSAYMDQLNKLGVPDSHIVIYVGQYTQADWQLDVARAGSLWVPAYGTDDGTIQTKYRPTLGQDLWQYTSRGEHAGITTLGLDMSTEPSDRFKAAYLTK